MRASTLRMLAALLWTTACLVVAQGCQSNLDESLDGLKCGPKGECLSGYECDTGTGKCVVLSEDEQNCRSCGTTCSAPPHGNPVCVDSECAFACEKGYTPCGTTCLDVSSDIENCGACGHACPSAAGGVATCTDGVCDV